jgi:hypothetical protein
VAVTTRDIRTSGVEKACDVCGRTLLRGERAEVYLDGGARRHVCELCKSRALNEGWVREGTVPSYEGTDAAADRRRSLFGRLRRRRESPAEPRPVLEVEEAEVNGNSWVQAPRRALEQLREPRHVRAIPTSTEQKIASAVELFNDSEHPRTVAGVARSLGPPDVAVLVDAVRPSQVYLVVSWELCWYRYEVDLADEIPSVRVAAQGSELHELGPQEREQNAVSGEHGTLSVAT